MLKIKKSGQNLSQIDDENYFFFSGPLWWLPTPKARKSLIQGPYEILFFFYRQLKSSLIGSNKAKNRVIEAGVVPRLLNLLTEPTVTHPDLKVAVAYALGKNVMIKFKVEKI